MKILWIDNIKYCFQEIIGNTKLYVLIRGYKDKFKKETPMRGSDSALYCYSIWLRYLKTMYEYGITTHANTILELGPGETLGCGIAALITGANNDPYR